MRETLGAHETRRQRRQSNPGHSDTERAGKPAVRKSFGDELVAQAKTRSGAWGPVTTETGILCRAEKNQAGFEVSFGGKKEALGREETRARQKI
jgi:hypothetical protein